MPINTKNNSSYRPEIDGLRAFAVIAVIINHFNKQILPGGYLGVDIFFVISGFVITSSLYQRQSIDFKDFIIGFYARRIKRLVPALSFFVLIISILICFFNPYPGADLFTGISSLFGLSNIYLLQQQTDYFAQSTQLNVFTHTWSLGVEEQFYLFFPFLIWFSGFGRHAKNGARNLFLLVGSITIASLIGYLYFSQINQSVAYFLMPLRFWEMASGCLLFVGLQKKKLVKQLIEMVPPLLSFTLIIGVMFLPMRLASFSTIAVVCLSLFLIASLKKNTIFFKLFTNPKVVYIGLISYSLYLWHWGILSISRWTIGIHWWSFPLQVTIIFCMAIASYQWIEIPLRKGIWFGKQWKNLLVGIAVLILVSMNLVVLGKPLKGKLYNGDKFNKWNMKIFRDTKNINNSKFPTIYLIGDSHAGHYGAVMNNLVSQKEFNLIMHPRGDGLKLSNKLSEEYVLAPLRKYKKNFKKGDIIIFSASILKYKDKYDWTNLYETFINQTKNIGIKYVLISPTPTFSKVQNIFTCQVEWYRPVSTISEDCFATFKKSEWVESNVEPMKLIEEFLLKNQKVFYIDAFSLLCPNDYCTNNDKESFMYIDEQHLSSYGAMKLSKTFEIFIKAK